MSDKTANLKSALIAGKGKTVMLTEKLYSIEGKVEVNMGGEDIEISSRYGSKLYLSNTTSISSYQIPEGNIKIENAGNVILSGITIEGVRQNSGGYILPMLAQGDGGSSLCNIVFMNCKNVLIDNCSITDAVYAGIRCMNVDRITIRDSNINYNTYAGAHIHNVRHIVAVGNSFSYNGWKPDSPASSTDYYGYGITCSHRYGQPVDNTSVYIAGNKCWYNTRKSIDLHNAVGAMITGNDCLGSSISAVNESGSDPDDPTTIDPNWAKHVQDIIISGNYLHNDIAWHNSIQHTAPFQWITIGSFATTPLGHGCVVVKDNIIKDCNMPDSRAVIWCAVNIGGKQIETIKISNNILYDIELEDKKYGYPEEYDGAIELVNGTVAPKFVDISGNILYGKSVNGIKCAYYNPNVAQKSIVNMNNNQFMGTFKNPVFVDRDVKRLITNNYYNGKRLPDLDNEFNGTLNAQLITSTLSSNFTVDTTSNVCLMSAGQSIFDNTQIRFSSSGSLPSPLLSGNTYYAKIGDNDFNFTADPITNIFTASRDVDIYENMGVRFSTSGILPLPLALDTTYYIKYISPTTFKITASINGPEINITSAGTGEHKINNSNSVFKVITDPCSFAVTVNTSTNIFTAAEPQILYEGMAVRIYASTLPQPLSSNITYYIKYLTSTTFQLASAPGGAEINITTPGSGDILLSTFKSSTEAVNITNTGSGTHILHWDFADLITSKSTDFTDGGTLFDIRAVAFGASPKFGATFYFSAWAKNDNGAPVFGTSVKEYDWVFGELNDSYIPAISWIGTGDTRTLRFNSNTSYTNFNIEVKMSSWRNHLLTRE